MTRQRILVTMTGLQIGGAERSLLGLLHELDYARVDVDLFLFLHEGEWLDQIPRHVRLLPQIDAYAALCKPIRRLRDERRHGWFALRQIARYAAACLYKVRGLKVNEHGLTQVTSLLCMPFLPRLSREKYDLSPQQKGISATRRQHSDTRSLANAVQARVLLCVCKWIALVYAVRGRPMGCQCKENMYAGRIYEV